MKAIILAAGAGSKCFPYDLTRQKAAMPVGDTSVIRWTCECLQRAGVHRIAVVVGHLQERVRHALLGIDVVCVVQSRLTGTAPAMLQAVAQVGGEDPLLVLYGDCLLSEEAIRSFVELTRKEHPFAAAMVARLGGRDPRNWLCAQVNEDRLIGVSGHPRGAELRLCGVYYFSPATLPFIQANPGFVEQVNVGGMPKREAELAQSVHMMAQSGPQVRAVEHRGLFVDIDKPWHVLEANAQFARYLCSRLAGDDVAAGASVSDGAEISGHIRLGPGCRIGNRVVIHGNLVAGAGTQITNGAIVGGDCVLGERVKVRDYCSVGAQSVLGNDCLVGHGAELGGVCFEGAYLYHYCEMSGVFGSRHDVGAATVCGTLRFDDGTTPHTVDGRSELPEVGGNDAYFGDYTRTGVNAIIMPGVKVGAYSCIGPGVIQYHDVDHKTLVLAKQETVSKPWGPEKYGW